MTFPRRFAALLLGGALGLAACSQSGATPAVHHKTSLRTENRENAKAPHVAVANQHSNGHRVLVSSVAYYDKSTTAGGKLRPYVVVAADVGGKPGTVLCSAPIKEGVTHSLVVNCSDRLSSGTYFAMVVTQTSPPSGQATQPLTEARAKITVSS